MKTKNKIALSIGSLLVIIITMGFFTLHSINRMKQNTENILKNNYNSIGYSQKMLNAINLYDKDSITATRMFYQSMQQQKNNITEQEEKVYTDQLEKNFERYRHNHSKENIIRLGDNINIIIKLNADTISQKSELAVQRAHTSMLWAILLSMISVMIAVFMLLKFPKLFTRPIKQLLAGIIEISNHNYEQRLHFDEDSEFAPVAISFNNMAKELSLYQKSSMARIISTKKYLETVINAIGEPILGLDKDKTILFANEALTQILNLKIPQMLQRSALDLSLSNDLLRRLIRGLEKSESVEEKHDAEPLKIYSNNKENYYEVHYLRLPENIGTVILLTDVTKFKMLDNAKTNFISVISHELKTPIAAIMMSLKLLEDKRIGEMNEEQTNLTKGIEENSNRLISITSELLKMTQVEAGVIQLNPKITKPIELIEYAIKATRVLADRWNCNIEVEYPDQKMPKLFVDSEKIAWVVTNLVSNAIHYSPENSRVIIGARMVNKNVEIYVHDFGKGIDPRYHQSIFDRYFRIPGTKVQGSGLGLAISKDFVEAHGGSIRVESEIGKGSCFTITLIAG